MIELPTIFLVAVIVCGMFIAFVAWVILTTKLITDTAFDPKHLQGDDNV